MGDAHDFSDDGRPRGFAGLEEQVKPFASEPLNRRRCAFGRRRRSIVAPAVFTALAMTICSSDSIEQGPAIMAVAVLRRLLVPFDDRVLRMEEAVGELAGVAYAANGFNRRKRQNLVGGQMQAGFRR